MSDQLYQIKDCASQFYDFDKALLFKMGVNDEDSLNSLLTYYRDRVNDIDKERVEWLEKLEEIKIKMDEKHKQDWEIRKRTNEVADLQKSISEQKLALFEERQLALKYQRENDALKIKEQEDRKKIKELLSLTDPVEENIVLQKDVRPNVTQKYVQNDLNINRNKENMTNVIQRPVSGKYTTGGLGKSLVKTIYLPNETLNTVSQENECLKRYIEEDRKNFAEQLSVLKDELKIKDDEFRLQYNQQNRVIQEQQDKLQKIEKQHLGLTKEFFQVRQKCNDSEKRLHEENELLRLKNTALANKMVIVQKQAEVENKVSKELLENKCDEYTSKFRNQAKKKDDSLQIIKNQYAQAQKIYLSKVKDLEESLSKLAEKYYQLEKKRNLENSRYQSEIRELNKKVNKLEFNRMQEEYQDSEPSLTRSEKEMIQIQQQEQEYKKQQQQLAKKKHDIYGNTKKQTNKKTLKKKPVRQQQPQFSSDKKSRYSEQQQQYQQHPQYEEQEDQQYEDQQQLQQSRSETAELQELEDIQQQLDDLEKQLDLTKKA